MRSRPDGVVVGYSLFTGVGLRDSALSIQTTAAALLHSGEADFCRLHRSAQ